MIVLRAGQKSGLLLGLRHARLQDPAPRLPFAQQPLRSQGLLLLTRFLPHRYRPCPQVGIQDGWPSGHRISPPPPVPPGLGSGCYGSGLSSGIGVSSMTPLGLNHGLGVPPPPPPLPVPEVSGRIEEPSRYVQALPKLEEYS